MTQKFEVYGLGNALVDYEVKVSDDYLKEHNMDKGLMTLIDEANANRLMEAIKEESYGRACGGSAANTLIGLAQMDGKTFYSCKVANDDDGKFYAKDLYDNGVESHLAKTNEAGVTGKCFAYVTPDADRTLCTYLGITGSYSWDQVHETEFENSEWIYIEGYLVASPSAFDAIKMASAKAKEKGIKRSLTLSDPGIVAGFSSQFAELLADGKYDLIFCNEDEAKAFAGTDDLEKAEAKLLEVSHAYALTRGKAGAIIFQDGERYEVPGFPVKAVDTTGAGDMFAAGYFSGLIKGWGPEKAARWANKASSVVVSKYGPRLEKTQTSELLQKFEAGEFA